MAALSCRRAARLPAHGRRLWPGSRDFSGLSGASYGERPDAAALKSLQPADLRAFMAKRRRDGLESRSLLRALAAVRNFLRFIEKKGLARTDVFGAVRPPKRPHSLPKALTVPDARDVVDPEQRAGEAREPWVIARDAAVLALLYGAGLRISEALSIGSARGAGRRRRSGHDPGEGRQEPDRAGHRAGARGDRSLSRSLSL